MLASRSKDAWSELPSVLGPMVDEALAEGTDVREGSWEGLRSDSEVEVSVWSLGDSFSTSDVCVSSDGLRFRYPSGFYDRQYESSRISFLSSSYFYPLPEYPMERMHNSPMVNGGEHIDQ
jgi:hypothetical protein